MQINANTMYNSLMIAHRINNLKSYVAKSSEKLSSGKAINSASDSPSDILRISRMSSQIRGSQAAQRNIQNAMSLAQVMDSSLEQMHNMGLRLKELSVQYNNSTLSAEDKSIIEQESTELIKEMSAIMENTNFAGLNVFAKNKYEFQTGNSLTDKAALVNPLFDKKIIIESTASIPAKDKEVISRTYDISMQLPFGYNLPGEIKLNLKDVEKDQDIKFTINTGSNQISEGKLNFVDDDTARFELHVKSNSFFGYHYNIKLTGTIELNENADKTDLSGEGTYTIDHDCDGLSGKITFTLKTQEENPATPEVPGEQEEMAFKDIDKIPIGTILKEDFVDKNILNPLASSRASIGVTQNMLEFKISRQQETEVITTDALSKIEDVDMAKEMLAKVKNELLLQTNIQLLSQNLDDQRSYVLGLLL